MPHYKSDDQGLIKPVHKPTRYRGGQPGVDDGMAGQQQTFANSGWTHILASSVDHKSFWLNKPLNTKGEIEAQTAYRTKQRRTVERCGVLACRDTASVITSDGQKTKPIKPQTSPSEMEKRPAHIGIAKHTRLVV
jgi:hypothetical protein